jgi:fermentation-respiration switch protein FrsA (DUF1100 family)
MLLKALGVLSEWPSLWAARFAGFVPLFPSRAVSSLSPRSLLLIAGDADPVVDATVYLHSVASEPKELWIARGAGHGKYAETVGEPYAHELTAFLERALQ